MARKYDKYGNNRQFKTNPASRSDPFPRDHLPFQDTQSNGARASKIVSHPVPRLSSKTPASSSNPPRSTPSVSGHSRKDIERAWQLRRAATIAMRNAHPDGGLGANRYKWNAADTRMVAEAVTALVAPVAAAEYGTIRGFSNAARDAKWLSSKILKATTLYGSGRAFIDAIYNKDVGKAAQIANRHL